MLAGFAVQHQIPKSWMSECLVYSGRGFKVGLVCTCNSNEVTLKALVVDLHSVLKELKPTAALEVDNQSVNTR